MSLTSKALWVIERNLERSLTLADTPKPAAYRGITWPMRLGRPPEVRSMQFIRKRRLTVAAHRLASGQTPDILKLALDTGYGSHEAFSRAFRGQLARHTEKVRRQKTETLPLIRALKAGDDNRDHAGASPVGGRHANALVWSRRAAFHRSHGMHPAQWQRFMASYGEISHKADPIPLAVSTNMDDDGTFEYVCAVQVDDASDLPKGLIQLRVPAQRYAVFQHLEHVSTIATTYSAIWNYWLPAHIHKAADGPGLERNLKTFNPQTGLGGMEIWIPLEAAA